MLDNSSDWCYNRFMSLQITNSLSWGPVKDELEQQFRRLPGARCVDAYKMLRNVDSMVKNLACKEVEVRAGRVHPDRLKEPVEKFNEIITLLEEFLLIELLSR